MIHLAAFSVGKDSTAVLCWLKEQGIEFTAVFCDVGWEHPLTYAYVEEINRQVIDGKLVTLKSEKYDGFVDLCVKKQMVPQKRARFCTQELKTYPLHGYIESLDDEATVYQGIRADESIARSTLPKRSYVDDAGGYWIERPLLDWTAEECFALAKRHGVKPNPLYLMGSSRVGCWPCIYVGQRDLARYLKATPEIRQRILDLERVLNEGRTDGQYRAFFRGDYIPDRYHSMRITKADGRTVTVPTAEDVFRYVESVDENQLPMFETPKCMSVYNLCE